MTKFTRQQGKKPCAMLIRKLYDDDTERRTGAHAWTNEISKDTINKKNKGIFRNVSYYIYKFNIALHSFLSQPFRDYKLVDFHLHICFLSVYSCLRQGPVETRYHRAQTRPGRFAPSSSYLKRSS